LAGSKSSISTALNLITCTLMFVNAFIYQKKINKDNKD
jgi:hypothetical protein